MQALQAVTPTETAGRDDNSGTQHKRRQGHIGPVGGPLHAYIVIGDGQIRQLMYD